MASAAEAQGGDPHVVVAHGASGALEMGVDLREAFEHDLGRDIDRHEFSQQVAQGGELSVKQEDLEFRGHSIECRINAEDPKTFAPSPGRVSYYHPPGGMHVRVDSGLYAGYAIPPYYDSMISKLIVYGRTRESCMMRMRRALEEMVIEGVKTNIPLHKALLSEPDVINGDYSIKWLEAWLAGQDD